MLWQRPLITSRRFTATTLALRHLSTSSSSRRLNGVSGAYATVIAGNSSSSQNRTFYLPAAPKGSRWNLNKKAFFSSLTGSSSSSSSLPTRAAHQQCLIAPPPSSIFAGKLVLTCTSTRNQSTGGGGGPKKPSDSSSSSSSKRVLPSPACNKIAERNLKDQQQQQVKQSKMASSSAASSKIRQNYNEISEAAVNKQINLELYAAYFYQQLAFHFNRDDVALPGFEKFFAAASKEEREHAEKLMKYQNLRGGRIVLQDIPKPIKQSWSSGLEAMEAALELEKTVNQSLLDLHNVASKHDDPQFADYLETHYLTEQVEAIKKLSDYVTNLRRVGSGLGEYLFDKHTLSS
nr:Tyr p 30 allergen [Tyrophagus putrescentiae]